MQQRIPDKINHTLIKTFTCNKLSEHAKGKLQYQLWQNNEDSSLGLALSHNESAGGFSNELIAIQNILTKLAELHQRPKPFHATALKDLFVGRSANNHCFLAAVLVDQKVIQPHTQVSRLLEVHPDFELWSLALEDHLKNVDIAVQAGTVSEDPPIDQAQEQNTSKPKVSSRKNAKQTLASADQEVDSGEHHAIHQAHV